MTVLRSVATSSSSAGIAMRDASALEMIAELMGATVGLEGLRTSAFALSGLPDWPCLSAEKQERSVNAPPIRRETRGRPTERVRGDRGEPNARHLRHPERVRQ